MGSTPFIFAQRGYHGSVRFPAARSIRVQDVVLLLLFAALAWTGGSDRWVIAIVAVLGLLQLAEPRVVFSQPVQIKAGWILIKLAIGYVLIGYTGGLTSPYYLILLLPVVSAATALGVIGTLAFTVVSCTAYLSFLLFIDWTQFAIEPAQVVELARRLVFLALSGTLVNTLAGAVRDQYLNYKRVAEQLEDANRSLREAEAQVRRSERLAALGQLSAGLAHELRNPLGTIKASAEMLARGVSSDGATGEVAREIAGFIVSEADRTNSLVSRFLDFARPLQLKLETAALPDVIDDAVAEARREASARRVSIYRNDSPDLRPFAMDAELMQRVLVNLLVNAVQASPEGGTVTIKTRAAGHSVEIDVIDRGCGVEPKMADTIFNPFVTTKSTGTGLGLAIVSKIVDEHGGKVVFESAPGQGTVFRVLLPLRLAGER
jgi:two-component system, NtrC family, sensor histidine kinase HydH